MRWFITSEISLTDQQYSNTCDWRRSKRRHSYKPFRRERKIKNKKGEKTAAAAARKKNCHMLWSKKNTPPPLLQAQRNRVENYCDVDRTISTEEGRLMCTAMCQHKREHRKIWSALHFKNTPSANNYEPICIIPKSIFFYKLSSVHPNTGQTSFGSSFAIAQKQVYNQVKGQNAAINKCKQLCWQQNELRSTYSLLGTFIFHDFWLFHLSHMESFSAHEHFSQSCFAKTDDLSWLREIKSRKKTHLLCLNFVCPLATCFQRQEETSS